MARAALFGRIRSFGLFGALLVAAAAYGCSGESGTSGTGITGSSSSSAATSSGEGGKGGGSSTSGGGGAGGTPIFMGTVTEVASGAAFQFPYDATPDPKGDEVYFVAVAPDLQPGIFTIKTDGSGTVQVVSVGAPLVSPTGIAISTDGSELVIADPGWDTKGAGPGALVTMPVGGGTPKAIAGTEGYAPQGVDIIQEGGKDVVYFTSNPPASERVYKVDLAGGTPQFLIMGIVPYPFDSVSGITVSSLTSVAYMVNVDAVGQGSVVKVDAPDANPFLEGLDIGNHGGAALSLDGSELFVSTRDPATKASTILRVTIATKAMTSITDVIKDFNEPAGLHRAHKANVFAFVDNQAHGTGAVFVIR